jgi:hypothetical protein
VRSDLVLMMAVNGLVSSVLLLVLFLVFGIRVFLPVRMAGHTLLLTKETWAMLALMVPGSGIGFACLWYWLILRGRSRGVAWGAAGLYGVAVAFCALPFAGFCIGLLYDQPFLFGLVALALLLLMPNMLAALTVFGLAMGAFNGIMAHRWIAFYRPGA